MATGQNYIQIDPVLGIAELGVDVGGSIVTVITYDLTTVN